MKTIPYILIGFRLCLAPTVLLLSWIYGSRVSIGVVVLMYLGLISDILDGIIARKLNVSTERMRRLDGRVDLIFWISISVSSWINYPVLIAEHKIFIFALIGMELLCFFTSLVKFKKEISTHSFLSKLWGLTLLSAFTALFCFGMTGIPFYLCVVVGLVSQLEVMLIILLLPRYHHDIPSLYHAYLIRNGKPFKKNKYLNG